MQHHLPQLDSRAGFKEFLADVINQLSPSGAVSVVWILAFVLPCAIWMVLDPTNLWILVWFAVGMLLMMLLVGCQNQRWLVMLASWVIPKTVPVRVMDFEGETVYTLVYGEFGRTLRGHSCWYFCIGPIELLPNGLVRRSYQYFWQPLRHQQACEMALAWDLPSFESLAKMNSGDRINCRQALVQQAKFMHEQFDI